MTQQSIEEIASTFHVFDPAIAENPYPLLERFQSECPIAHSDMFGGYWLLTKYADIREVLADASIWSSSVPALPKPPMDEPLNYIPVGIDPPDHTAYRRILGPVFGPARVAALEDDLRARAVELIDKMRTNDGPVDFLPAFAVPFPVVTILETFGLPVADLDVLLDFKRLLLDEQYSVDPVQTQHFADVTTPIITEYFVKEIVHRRRDDAPDDMFTAIVRSTFKGERDLTDHEIVSIATLILSAGLDTVTSELCVFLAFFAEHPDRWQEIIDHPDRIPGAVEELLRINSIVTLHRHATKDTTVGGHPFAAGEFVQLSLPVAAFDPDEFPEPHKVDFQRKPNRHLAFGGGPHRCFGSNLARLELVIALEELSKAFPTIRYPQGHKPDRNFGLIINTLDMKLELA